MKWIKEPAIRLRFAAKYFSISNSWKKWMGVTKGWKDQMQSVKEQEETVYQLGNRNTLGKIRCILAPDEPIQPYV